MTNSEENYNQNQNTPRSRNRVLDNTPPMEAPEGQTGDWTFRKQIEADFRALQFKSHKFSHKNEPETRLADSLWLSWNRDNKNHPTGTAVEDIEVRVTFNSYGHPEDAELETTFHITYTGRSNSGCVPYQMGNAKMVIDYDTTDVFAHIHQILTKPRQP